MGDRGAPDPPLRLALADGTVEVRNETYLLYAEKVVQIDGDTRYNGLAAGDPVMVVGRVTAFDGQPRLEAEFVAAGNQADYVARRRGDARFARIFGLGFAGFGVIFLLVGIGAAVAVWRA